MCNRYAYSNFCWNDNAELEAGVTREGGWGACSMGDCSLLMDAVQQERTEDMDRTCGGVLPVKPV